jgi:hypothetical protein
MDKKPIRLTEQDLHFLVENAVQAYLVNEDVNEGVWGGLKNVWNGMKQGNLNVGQTYNSGNLSSNFQKFANQAQEAIKGMMEIANNTNNPQISRYLTQVNNTIGKSVTYFNNVSQQVAQGNTLYNQNNNAFKIDNNQINKMGYNKMYNKAMPKKA